MVAKIAYLRDRQGHWSALTHSFTPLEFASECWPHNRHNPQHATFRTTGKAEHSFYPHNYPFRLILEYRNAPGASPFLHCAKGGGRRGQCVCYSEVRERLDHLRLRARSARLQAKENRVDGCNVAKKLMLVGAIATNGANTIDAAPGGCDACRGVQAARSVVARHVSGPPRAHRTFESVVCRLQQILARLLTLFRATLEGKTKPAASRLAGYSQFRTQLFLITQATK